GARPPLWPRSFDCSAYGCRGNNARGDRSGGVHCRTAPGAAGLQALAGRGHDGAAVGRGRSMTRLIAALFVVGLALVATGGPQASDAPRELKWAQLIPPDAREKPKTLKPFFGQRPSSPAALKEDPNIPEAQWMSQPLSQRP